MVIPKGRLLPLIHCLPLQNEAFASLRDDVRMAATQRRQAITDRKPSTQHLHLTHFRLVQRQDSRGSFVLCLPCPHLHPLSVQLSLLQLFALPSQTGQWGTR